ncbi:integrase, partial [Blautia producta]|nr:integrase [Blautia producta]
TVIKGHKDRMSVGNVERIIKKYAAQIRSMNITVRQSRQSGVARATCPD